MTDQTIITIIEAALDAADPAGDWTEAVDQALAAAGVETGEELDGSDPYEIVRLADGRLVVRQGDTSNAVTIIIQEA